MKPKYIISCDTGKREYVGAFRTGFFAMRAWRNYIRYAKAENVPWTLVYACVNRDGSILLKKTYHPATPNKEQEGRDG